MKKVLFSSILLAAGILSASALACTGENYENFQVALDANGTVTRSEMREVSVKSADGTEKKEFQNVVIDRITLESGDEIRLNAAPNMMDASIHVVVKVQDQKADQDGIFSTTYAVKEIWTSGWGGPRETQKNSLVTVHSNYLGEGKRSHECGRFEVVEVAPAKKPAPKKF
ncbi:MAG: hypothetical protein JST04_07465 [Bdellovibrionales bacterium]|nr:hypothetical protein [Bdellovibrionales bacterium]